MEKDEKGTGKETEMIKKRKWQNPFAVYDGEDLLCGVGSWKPQWLQVCNNMKVFMLCYVCLGVFRGMSHSYLSAVLPSIEKRFGFSSQMIGTVKAMSDVSHLLTALLIAHFGGAGHRPRWISLGMFIVGVGFLVQAAPEIIFPQVSKQRPSTFGIISKTSSAPANEQFCKVVTDFVRNTTRGSKKVMDCAKESTDEHVGPLIVLGVAEFLIGLGGTTSMILGLPFVDDQVKAKNTPLYYALSFCGMVFGPLLGLGLGAIVNNIYVDLSTTTISTTDPRWISAWYIGFLVCGVGTCIFALTVGCFPSAIPESTKRRRKVVANEETKSADQYVEFEPSTSVQQKQVTLRDLPRNLKRLLLNRIYTIELFSQLLNSFIIAGYMSFMQKFIKEQYQLPQSTSNLSGGIPPIFAGFIGIILGSIIMKRFKFSPRQVCFLMSGSALCGAACYFSVIAMGCDRLPIVGLDDVADPYNTTSSGLCFGENDCRCGKFKFNPVCDLSTRTSYVSACEAGCKSAGTIKHSQDKTKYYFGCSCMVNATFSNDPIEIPPTNHSGSTVISGLCKKSCPNFVAYVVVMSIAKLFMGLPMAGVIMVQFRVVDCDLKSLANGVSTIVMSGFGFLPAPILAGMLIDSACILWEKSSCGVKGACWLYNADDFRWKLHAAVGICRLITFFLDLIVAYKVRNITFDREVDSKKGPPTVPSMAMIANFEEQELNELGLANNKPVPSSV